MSKRPSSLGDENPSPAKVPRKSSGTHIGLPLARHHCKEEPGLRSEHKSCAHTRWERLTVTDLTDSNGNEWVSFHEDWWHTEKLSHHWDIPNGQAAGDGVIHMGQDSLLTMFDGLPASTNGALLLRKELMFTCKRIDDAYSENPSFHDLPGIILSGQPGIGKSYAGLLLLLIRLQRGLPTLFTTSVGRMLLFDVWGVWRIEKANDFFSMEMLPFPTSITARPWSIIDAEADKNPPIRLLIQPTLLPIYTVSPDIRRYSHWLKHSSGVRFWIFDPWTPEELLQWYQLLARKPSKMQEQDQKTLTDTNNHAEALTILRTYINISGPCPRDLELALKHGPYFSKSVDRYLNLVQTNDAGVIKLVLGANPAIPNDISSQFALLRRVEANNDGRDDYTSDFKSAQIARKCISHAQVLELQDAEQLFKVCRVAPEASTLGGWIFESIAIRLLANSSIVPATVDISVGSFEAMRVDPDDCLSFSHGSTAASAPILLMNEHGPSIVEAVPVRELRSSSKWAIVVPARPTGLPIQKKRAIYIYREDDQLQANPERFYVPKKQDNSLFDALLLHEETNVSDPAKASTVIWVLQMTTARVHGGSSTGYVTVRTAKTKVEESGRAAIIRYVLVVPYDEGRRVVWQMPVGWEGVEGEVFIQYVNVKTSDEV